MFESLTEPGRYISGIMTAAIALEGRLKLDSLYFIYINNQSGAVSKCVTY